MPSATIADFQIPAPTMHRSSRGFFARVLRPEWDSFFESSIESVFRAGGKFLDIGGGMRIDGTRGNRVNPRFREKFARYLTDPKVDYRVTDYTSKYSPDYVEDIHALSFPDASFDAVFCIAVLEHVYDPKRGIGEILRVLKSGGKALIYVPFVYRYHAHAQDYRDYYRFTCDGIAYLFRDCRSVKICPVRGIFETLLLFLPFGRVKLFTLLARALDESLPILRRVSQKQTSGYFVMVVK
ncbi:MAG: class I SAM-dependent methyltransferase [Candidatus Peribacteraceae bacterium]